MPSALFYLLALALLNPQQTRDSRQLRAHSAFRSPREAQERSELLLRLIAFEPLSPIDEQLASRAVAELFPQHVRRAGSMKLDLDIRLAMRLVPWNHIPERACAIPLHEHRTDGLGNRAFTGLIRSGNHIQPWLEFVEVKRVAELPEFLDENTLQPHCIALRSRWNLASSNNASCAAAPCSGSSCKALSRSTALAR
ncbi:hypothetical protein Y600_5994 [Burkholderia pseudomallei MSHR3709]|nr:hypothetical protein Y600_5994 [Burkholderia pseudomallei MSHR3709]